MYSKIKSVIGCFLVFTFLNGCAGVQPMSNYARTGSTVTVALHGASPHEFIEQEDLTAEIVDASGTYPIPIRRLMRVYPDPASTLSWNRWALRTNPFVSVPGEKGQWLATVDLIHPDTNNPLPLVAGDTVATLNFQYSGEDQITIASQSLTIIDGVGEPHSLQSLDNNAPWDWTWTFKPTAHLNVSVVENLPIDPDPHLAAIKMVISCSTQNYCPQPGAWYAVQAVQHPNIQLLQSAYITGDPGSEINVLEVNLINAKGFDGAVNGGKEDLPILVVLGDNYLDADQDAWVDNLQFETTFYDINGNEISASLTPSIRALGKSSGSL